MTDRYSVETSYAAVTFRSRLEARWAAFFDRIGWRWSYEPYEGDRYLPDFAIHGPSPLLVEVRPVMVQPEYERQIPTMRIDPHKWEHDLLIVGLDPVMVCTSEYLGRDIGTVTVGRGGYGGDPSAGLLGEHGDSDTWEGWAWGNALWHRCLGCRGVAVHHEEMTFRSRPCGCYAGDGYLGALDQVELDVWWRAAGQQVRWNPNPAATKSRSLGSLGAHRRARDHDPSP